MLVRRSTKAPSVLYPMPMPSVWRVCAAVLSRPAKVAGGGPGSASPAYVASPPRAPASGGRRAGGPRAGEGGGGRAGGGFAGVRRLAPSGEGVARRQGELVRELEGGGER